MLRSEGGWTLSLRLASSVERGLNTKSGTLTLGRKGLDNGPMIRLLSRKEQHTKAGTLTLQDARLPCGKRMAYATV